MNNEKKCNCNPIPEIIILGDGKRIEGRNCSVSILNWGK
jgi:hypothetical protein